MNLGAKYMVFRIARNYHLILQKLLFMMKDFQGVDLRFCMWFVTGTVRKLE